MKMSDRSVWEFKRNLVFTNRLLLGYFMEKFSNRKLVYLIIHQRFFCESLGSYLQSIDGTIGTCILVDGGARRISGVGEGKDVL